MIGRWREEHHAGRGEGVGIERTVDEIYDCPLRTRLAEGSVSGLGSAVVGVWGSGVGDILVVAPGYATGCVSGISLYPDEEFVRSEGRVVALKRLAVGEATDEIERLRELLGRETVTIGELDVCGWNDEDRRGSRTRKIDLRFDDQDRLMIRSFLGD